MQNSFTSAAIFFVVLLPLRELCAVERPIPVSELPDRVIHSFETAYPHGVIKKSISDDTRGLLRFNLETFAGGVKRKLVYSVYGALLEEEEIIAEKELPDPVKNTLATRLASQQKNAKEKIVMAKRHFAERKITYEITLRNSAASVELRISPDGNIVDSTPKK